MGELTKLVMGIWNTEMVETAEAEAAATACVAAREKLPKLKVLFMGDIIHEENEVS